MFILKAQMQRVFLAAMSHTKKTKVTLFPHIQASAGDFRRNQAYLPGTWNTDMT